MAVKLSIIMPVYNGTNLAVKMIDSIRVNDFEDWELLVIDDGSTDDEYNILSNYCSGDKRIHHIRRDKEPKGAQTCRNIGIENAIGKYVIFFDSDDYIAPFCLKQRVEALEQHPLLDFMIFPSGIVENDKFYDQEHEFAYGYNVINKEYDAFARRLLPFIVWNNIYRLESLRKSGVQWDTNLLSLQDADFNLQTLVASLKYDYYNGNADIGYRIDANSGSVSKKVTSAAHTQSTLYAIDKYYQIYTSHFGHKYNSALYYGVLFLYNWIQTDGIESSISDGMANVVYKYSKFYGFLLKSQILITRVLQHVLSKKRSRQIPMIFYLLSYRRRIQKKKHDIHIRICRFKKN